MPDRERFSEEQARAILKRAAERQHRADLGAEARTTGLSLRDLERAAAAAGIEPAHVAAAVRDAERAEPSVPESVHDRLMGRPTTIRLERLSPGQLDEALWQKLVVELRRTFNTPGIPSTLGALHEWRSNESTLDQAELIAEEVEGEVRLTLRRSWVNQASGGLASLVFGGGLSALFLGLGLFVGASSLAFSWAAALAVLAVVGFGIARSVFRRFAGKQTARFEGLMDRLDGIVAAHEARPEHARVAEAATATEPVLSLDDTETTAAADPALNPVRTSTRS
ncbi:MAG: hypothetical protein AAF624_14575 [Bacteroidota bacterium]